MAQQYPMEAKVLDHLQLWHRGTIFGLDILKQLVVLLFWIAVLRAVLMADTWLKPQSSSI
ncbi:hypothetical protein CALCODRAFT_502993 [Calocera cornea HHB12733]|uniref:Uncharacterized protein n=1 Tax=Calocera cornea HHB12733 TaxID=1353952 RepID=A0A165D1D6_9BASI|nr:hypothetical protein CALCODRAFT_502993 [Calocera cornea HHB12733]